MAGEVVSAKRVVEEAKARVVESALEEDAAAFHRWDSRRRRLRCRAVWVHTVSAPRMARIKRTEVM